MKTSAANLALLGTLGLCTAPALAGKQVASAPKALKAPVAPAPNTIQPLEEVAEKPAAAKLGESFDILARRHETTVASDAEPTLKLRGLTENQVGQVTKSRLTEIEYCWDRLPTARRIDTTAVLKLSIEPIGSVAAIELKGEMHAELRKCITAAANRWRFPVTDAATEIEYAVALKTALKTP